jgi:putative ABC transport system permease protein
MSIGELWRRLHFLTRRQQFESDIEDEIRLHLELRAEEAGSAHTAKRQFGNTTLVKENSREMWNISRAIGAFAQDAKYGIRSFAKTRGFTALAVLTLALGIGSSTAVFSLIDAILIRPLPYPQPEKIVFPWRLPAPGFNLGFDEFPWDRLSFLKFARESKTFQYTAAMQSQSFNLTGVGTPARLDGVLVSAAFFPALGVAPMLGRYFTEDEDLPGHERVVMLSHSTWVERFGADPNIVGHTLELNGAPYIVTGVMPPKFVFPRANQMPGSTSFPKETQLWSPIALSHGPLVRGEPSELAVIGRLQPEAGPAQAQAELDAFANEIVQEQPGMKNWVRTRVKTLSEQIAGDTRRPLLLIFGSVSVVLLIACCNVANLLLARSVKRKREFMLRAALGAGSGRLAGQVLAESIVLAMGGAIAGLVLAEAAIYFAKRFGPSNIPRLAEVALDARVFGFTLAVALTTGVLFGIVPAILSRRVDLAASLKEGSRGSARGALRHTILVAEVALALMLVIATGLLVRTFFHLLATDAGFNSAHVLTFELTLPEPKYPHQEQIVPLYQRALERLRAAPGVQSAGITEILPIGGAGESTALRIPDLPVSIPGQRGYANYTVVSPGYFSAVGTHLLRGRDFVESDRANSQPVAIINGAMAKKYWPNRDALGRPVGVPIRPYDMTIVGIVGDVKHLSLREDAAPEVYVLYTQDPWPSMLTMQVAVRTADLSTATAYAREAIRSVDPDLPLANVRMLSDLVDDSMTQPRFSMLLVALFGAFAVVLAAVGMYGVISYSVAQRTQEIGIRMALGAERRDVFRMILGQGARFAMLGVAIGIGGALVLTPLMTSFLYGVRPTDPLTYIFVSVFLIAVALLACYIPARRAMRLNPTIALRYE